MPGAKALHVPRRQWLAPAVAVLAMGWSIGAAQPMVEMTLWWVGCLLVGSAMLVGATAYALSEGRPLAAGCLMIATSPVALTAIASSESQGLFAVGVAAGVVVFLTAMRASSGDPDFLGMRLGGGAGFGVIGVFGVISWWLSSDPRGNAPSPSWVNVMNSTGDQIDGAIAVLGHGMVPMSEGAVLVWWGALGVIVGAALLSRRPRVALLLPVALCVYTLIAWTIRTGRGPLDGLGGLWLIVGAIVVTGCLVRLPERVEARVGVGLAVVAGVLAVWAVNSLSAVNETSVGWVWLSAAAVVVLVGSVWRRIAT